ncbi:MAG: histidine phosphatase family protein [Anaerolineae bacterium]|jgi:broad specificity phosphatase PhoE|nr:histidine phosphatase family protein [Anaerolineae bacterium]
MTTLLLVRHGATQANEIGYWQGWEDTALTEVGMAQAQAVARRVAREFAPVAVYSSSLRRALQTAEPIAQAVACPLIPHDGLREIHFGQISGLSLEQFRKGFPALFEAWTDKTNLDFAWPGGESRRAFFTRVWGAVDEILAAHPGDDTVVIVAHGGSLRAALAYLLPGQFTNWWTYDLRNASLTVVDVAAGEAQLRLLNDCAHLDAQ